MDIEHRFALWVDPDVTSAFGLDGYEAAAGLNKSAVGLRVICLRESDPDFQVKSDAILESGGACTHSENIFSDRDLSSVDHLAIQSNWLNGYPMPDDDNDYITQTYGSSGCKTCGAGMEQVAPFRLRKQPKFGRRSIMSLNWVFGEIFVRPDVYENMFRPFGIASRCVVNHTTDAVLENVLQLDIPTCASTFALDPKSSDRCEQCSAERWVPFQPGRLPKLSNLGNKHLFKPQNWFGSGGSSDQKPVVSKELYKAIKQEGLKGCTFHPIEPY